ncbi:MAG: transcriptional regulator NanR [Kiloniellales bacterium]|nr:transcriptional regulator NanR [Kiloniellales bacterium]
MKKAVDIATTDFAPIPRRKLYQEVVDRLVAQISGGAFAPGDQLPSERELMKLFGVGRPAIREALQTLDRMGIITVSHGERARVTAPDAGAVIEQIAATARHMLLTSPQTLDHLKEARLFFEVGMVRIAAVKAEEADLARLRRRLEDHRQALRDLDRFLEMDKRFHREIAAISGNPIYAAVSQAVFEWLEEFYVELVRLPGAEQITLTEHQAIFDAIAAHDPDAAAEAMTRHLTRANELYRQFECSLARKP